MHKFTKALAAIGLAAVMSQSAIAETMKLGFLVKQPEEPWFQTEWKFADKAGKDLGFEVIKIAVPDGEKTLNAIDSLAASGAKGFVICAPDPKLGSAIVAKARGYDMKVIAVDDQFVNAKGQPMEIVPLVMMAASKIGERQGQELYKEMQKRGWDVKDTAVMAITRITDGKVFIDQKAVVIHKPAHAIAAGMMLCPEDRKSEGIIAVHSVRDNINISARRRHLHGGCVINNGWEDSNAAHHIRSLNIKTPGAEQLIMNLSGGNQQKAILGRWLSEEMKVILLDEPTRGIDVGAKNEIYNVIYALAAQGVAVLFASSDLPEVLGVADRIVVMREGEISGELLHEQADERQALSLAMPKVSQAVA